VSTGENVAEADLVEYMFQEDIKSGLFIRQTKGIDRAKVSSCCSSAHGFTDQKHRLTT
jgi:hypothetical protein